jgi:hypothetical protein
MQPKTMNGCAIDILSCLNNGVVSIPTLISYHWRVDHSGVPMCSNSAPWSSSHSEMVLLSDMSTWDSVAECEAPTSFPSSSWTRIWHHRRLA